MRERIANLNPPPSLTKISRTGKIETLRLWRRGFVVNLRLSQVGQLLEGHRLTSASMNFVNWGWLYHNEAHQLAAVIEADFAATLCPRIQVNLARKLAGRRVWQIRRIDSVRGTRDGATHLRVRVAGLWSLSEKSSTGGE